MRQSFTYSNGISITYTLFDETNFHAHNPNSKLRLVSARTPVTTIQFAARQSGLEIRSRDSDFERQDDLYYACTRKVHDDDADGSWLGAKERSRRAQPLHPLPLRPYSTSILYQPSVRSLLFRFFFFFFSESISRSCKSSFWLNWRSLFLSYFSSQFSVIFFY